MTGYIYLFENKINNKKYVGQTYNIKSRYASHKYYTTHTPKPTDYFHIALNKYGIDNFRFSILFKINSNNIVHLNIILDNMEIFFIRKYKTTDRSLGYNLTEGGKGMRGYKVSEEIKLKYSISRRGRKHSETTKLKIGKAHKNKFVSKETRNKLSVSAKLRKVANKRGKSICQYSKDMILINTFISGRAASRSTSVNQSDIIKCCKGKKISAGGYIWKYYIID